MYSRHHPANGYWAGSKGSDADGLSGTVTFTQEGYKVKLVAEISGAKPGKHGIHVHEYGDCTGPDYQTAGGHLNPDGAAHGCPGSSEFHPGDLGNIEVGPDGHGRLDFVEIFPVANIGNVLLRRFTVTLDGKNHRIRFRRLAG